jgi:hypothetical protein
LPFASPVFGGGGAGGGGEGIALGSNNYRDKTKPRCVQPVRDVREPESRIRSLIWA